MEAEPQVSENWMEQAACRGKDPNIFIIERGENASPARRICAQCIVQSECLDYALAHPRTIGVWGNTTERERRNIRRERARYERA